MNILEAARKYGVEKIIYSSASSIYGVPEYLPVNEVHPKKPTTIYGVGKYAGEHMLRVYKELHGINYFVLRFTNKISSNPFLSTENNKSSPTNDGQPILLFVL